MCFLWSYASYGRDTFFSHLRTLRRYFLQEWCNGISKLDPLTEYFPAFSSSFSIQVL